MFLQDIVLVKASKRREVVVVRLCALLDSLARAEKKDKSEVSCFCKERKYVVPHTKEIEERGVYIITVCTVGRLLCHMSYAV